MSIIPFAFAAFGCLAADGPDRAGLGAARAALICPVPVAAALICPDDRPVLDDVAGLCLPRQARAAIWTTLTRLAAAPAPRLPADGALAACLIDGGGNGGGAVAALPGAAGPPETSGWLTGPARPWPTIAGALPARLELIAGRISAPDGGETDPLPEIVPIDGGIEGRAPVSAPIGALGVGSSERGRAEIDPPTVVPLPAPLWLLGAALMLIAGAGRRLGRGVS